jgi:hypothetical protein
MNNIKHNWHIKYQLHYGEICNSEQVRKYKHNVRFVALSFSVA